jgi:hypothetical protein
MRVSSTMLKARASSRSCAESVVGWCGRFGRGFVGTRWCLRPWATPVPRIDSRVVGAGRRRGHLMCVLEENGSSERLQLG